MIDRIHTRSSSLLSEASSWDLATWAEHCSLLPPEKIVTLFPFASEAYDRKDWKAKLTLIFKFLPRNLSLEPFSKTLSTEQLLEILTLVSSTSSEPLVSRQQLGSLFVGMPPILFQSLLLHITDQQLHVLREEAVTEPIQHHLSLLESMLKKEFFDLFEQFEITVASIKEADLATIDNERLTDLFDSIDDLIYGGELILLFVNQGLAIAWGSNRLDLIENLGHLKEQNQRFLLEQIGQNNSSEHPSTGIWKILHDKIDKLFSHLDSQGNESLMKNETPALEAIGKFSIWYLKDYYEVGLLPQIQSLSEIEAIASDDSKKGLEQRAELLAYVEATLNRLGLKTLQDLKESRIFSKHLLNHYVKAREQNKGSLYLAPK